MENNRATVQELSKAVIKLQQEVSDLRKEISDQKFTEEDLEFNVRTKGAWNQIDKGDCITQSREEFLKIMKIS